MPPTRANLAYPRRDTRPVADDVKILNWARNAALAPRERVQTPWSEAEVQNVLASGSDPVRAIGTRMSPGRLLDLGGTNGTLLDLRHLRGPVEVTADTATFGGATPLQEVYDVLSARGRMLPSSPGVIAEQTLAGALSTGTHGQGLRQGIVADSVLAVRVVSADGEVRVFDRDHPWFPAVQLGLGTLGVTTQVTVRTVPSPVYTCRKTAVGAGGLEYDIVAWNRDHELVKAWWFPDQDQVQLWAAREADAEEVARYRAAGSGLLEHAGTTDTMNATVDQHLEHLRDDTGIVDTDGKPYRTVQRFRDFTDVTGDIYQVFCRGIATPQINVEIGVPLSRAGEVVAAIKEWHARTRPHLHYPIILRCTGPSGAWLSPSHEEATCYFGFVVYYADDGSLSREGEDFLRAVERVLAEHGGRPHWGKYFDESLYDWSALYPAWDRFRAVRDALDPGRRFANAFTSGLFDGGERA
ncbi:D-arabinono-1,4-lactone oxidase [Jatrophihabitans sp. YIM 134969]